MNSAQSANILTGSVPRGPVTGTEIGVGGMNSCTLEIAAASFPNGLYTSADWVKTTGSEVRFTFCCNG